MSEAFERPFRPVELSDATLTSFAVQEMAQQLMTEEAFQTSGRNALIVSRGQIPTVQADIFSATDKSYILRPTYLTCHHLTSIDKCSAH